MANPTEREIVAGYLADDLIKAHGTAAAALRAVHDDPRWWVSVEAGLLTGAQDEETKKMVLADLRRLMAPRESESGGKAGSALTGPPGTPRSTPRRCQRPAAY